MGGGKSKLKISHPSGCWCCGYQKPKTVSILSLPRPPTLDTSSDYINSSRRGILAVKEIDFCFETNGEEHHTKKFKLMTREVDRCLVIRRGQAFQLRILLNRAFDINSDGVSFIFHVADVKMRGPSSDTTAVMPLLKKGIETLRGWNAVYESQTDSHLIVSVTPAADCVVAAWRIEIDTKMFGRGSLSYTHPLPVYVLFNPWCNNDSVYMPDESHREEYVQEDGGIIFRGVSNIIKPSPWHYAQFDKDILECALYLVSNIGQVKGRARGDPITTVRGLSAAVNGNDDNGVLWGNWSPNPSDYSDGTPPFNWIGSLEILQKYYKRKEPVKYAQCWVYAGVLTTICRALGIPCRPVTCFNSAHDSHGSLTIDNIVKFDENGNVVETENLDSVWNFHVWNEVWMDRPDFGSEYSGWQIIDSTPQEKSEDMYRCGPAPIKAVLNGELHIPYDVAFVVAEVNADIVTWKSSGTIQPLKLLSRDTTSVGQNISTKAVGNTKREDITSLYKHPEGTSKERETLETALRESGSTFARYYLNDAFNDVEFEFELRDDIKIGQDFDVVLHMKNHSTSNAHEINVILQVNSVTYRSVMVASVKKQEFNMVLAPEAKENITLLVTFDDYFKKLAHQGSFKIACKANIAERDYDYLAEDDFRVRNPDIKITYHGIAAAGQELTIDLELENPLPIPLKKGMFYVQATGLDTQLKVKPTEDVAPGAKARAQFLFVPQWAGRYQISAKFSSKELHDVDGFFSLNVAR